MSVNLGVESMNLQQIRTPARFMRGKQRRVRGSRPPKKGSLSVATVVGLEMVCPVE